MSGLRVPAPVLRVVGTFLVALFLGTGLLMVPAATTAPGGIGLLPAFFTATSALSVTGLVVLDTGTDFTGLGQGVILGLIQIGGMGVMLVTVLLGMLVAHRVGLAQRQTVLLETKQTDALGDTRGVVTRIVVFSLAAEALVAAVLSARFA
ncbi:hypothetical protein [Brevibacterium litoralis]|uniref:hypothetical protein n=1 Tax=Brevibacterium litoralis TaxID=3138935 RepID=UPI0032EE0F4D